MAKAPTPADLIAVSTTWWTLMAETQHIVAMRMMGMAGLWSVTPSENDRMVSEKGPAFAASAAAGTAAMIAGKRPDQIAAAAMKPLRAKTRANAARLGKRGPKLPG